MVARRSDRSSFIVSIFLSLVLAACGRVGEDSVADPEPPVPPPPPREALRVRSDAAPGGDGWSWDSALRCLEEALVVASSGDEIWVAAGVYVPGSDPGDSFVLREGVAVYGGFAGWEAEREQRDGASNPTILDGYDGATGSFRFRVVVGADDAILSGFVIRGGRDFRQDDDVSIGAGAGLFIDRTSPTVVDCIFEDNQARRGGAIAIFGAQSSPQIKDCVFRDNHALIQGGGVFVKDGSLDLVDCHVTNNTAKSGGGVVAFEAQLVVHGSFFHGNEALPREGRGGTGGGVYSYQGPLILSQSIFVGNRGGASAGGAYVFSDGQVDIIDCLFQDNEALIAGGLFVDKTGQGDGLFLRDGLFFGNRASYGSGGGALIHRSRGVVERSVFVENRAQTKGGGTYVLESVEIDVVNCVFVDNQAGGGGAVASEGSEDFPTNLVVTNGTILRSIAGEPGWAVLATGHDESSSTTLRNVIVRSMAKGGTPFVADPAGSILVAHSRIPFVSSYHDGGGVIHDDPLFVDVDRPGGTVDEEHPYGVWDDDPSNHGLRLSPLSPCRGGGSSSDAPADDLLGRIRSSPPDMGAYEEQ